MLKRGFGLALLSFLLAVAAHAEKRCTMAKYGQLPITMQRTRPLVQATINGKPALLMTDSGAFFSMLNKGSEQKFGLRLTDLPRNLQIHGTNGRVDAMLAKVKSLSIDGFAGGQVLHNVDFLVGGNSTVEGADGLVGQNILGSADTEYDLANGVIRLFTTKDCGNGSLAYWKSSAPVAVVEIKSQVSDPHVVGEAILNGKKIRVMFDSGAAASVLTRRAAKRVGVSIEDHGVAAAGLGAGLAQRRKENWIARFDTLDLGGEVVKNARLRISDIDLGGADMLLGSDFFLSHRLLIARSQGRLYFTYNGGPVFDLRNAGGVAASEAGATRPTAGVTAADSARPGSDGTSRAGDLDAAAYKRRAAASAGRRDFRSAIADLNAAIGLDADDPESYWQRGMAHLGNREPGLASQDFDRAIEIEPDYTKALVERGTLRLARRDLDGARSDFEASTRSASSDDDVQLDIAHRYMDFGRFADAVGYFDAWIAAHPHDARLPFGLTQRCRARALANENLQLALADCNSALRRVSRDSGMSDNRALVYQRLGKFDKAVSDYKASLKRQPKNPWTLYGLGLAEKSEGLQSEGDAEIRAALAMNPRIGDAFRRIGLNP